MGALVLASDALLGDIDVLHADFVDVSHAFSSSHLVRLKQRIAYITRNDALTALQERVAEPEGGDDDDGVRAKPD
jgi:hypothetical protein